MRKTTRKKTGENKNNTGGNKNKMGGNKNNKTCKYNPDAKLKKTNCSPLGENGFTCYTDKSLLKMKEYWNVKHPDCEITETDSKGIWLKLKGFMSDVCDIESCWLKQKFMQNNLNSELLNYTFSPDAPDSWKGNEHEWLSSVDIEKVMKQYEKKYPSFKFIGPSPIDFDTKKMYGECVWDELCKFNIKNMLNKGVNKVGIIFNTDPHYESGSHWISMFVDLIKNKIYYFDSVGDAAPSEVDVLAERIQKQGVSMKRTMTYENTEGVSHQKQNTECGVYSIYFIVSMLEGDEFDKFKHEIINDGKIFTYRDKFFNLPE